MIILSTCLVVIYLLMYLLNVYPEKKIIDQMKAKMISMTLGMTNSLLIGLVVGIQLQGNFAASTIMAVLIGFVIAIIIGSPFGSSATTEALCSSLMGGMMGAMAGEMLPVQDRQLLLFFMDSIYIFSTAYMFLLVKKEKVKKANIAATGKLSISVIFSIILFLLTVSTFQYTDPDLQEKENQTNDHNHMHH